MDTNLYTYTSIWFDFNFSNQSKYVDFYEWDFGDGSAKDTAQNPMHTFPAQGMYYVCQTMTNLCDSITVCDSVFVSCPLPVSEFTYLDNLLSVQFWNTASGYDSLYWDFDDNSSSILPNPTHIYNSPGTYNVCLLATHTTCGSDEYCDTITVDCPVPTTIYTYTDSSLTVQFTNGSSNETSRSWDFGNGNTDTTRNPTHTFSAPGPYYVCLNNINSCGNANFCDSVMVQELAIGIADGTTSELVVSFDQRRRLIRISSFNATSSDIWVELFDILGIRQHSSTISGSEFTLDVSGLPAGLYILTGRNRKGLLLEQKLIIY